MTFTSRIRMHASNAYSFHLIRLYAYIACVLFQLYQINQRVGDWGVYFNYTYLLHSAILYHQSEQYEGKDLFVYQNCSMLVILLSNYLRMSTIHSSMLYEMKHMSRVLSNDYSYCIFSNDKACITRSYSVLKCIAVIHVRIESLLIYHSLVKNYELLYQRNFIFYTFKFLFIYLF